MKPKAENKNDDGLLEYLEDIIGTSEYKDQIEQGLVKIDELNDGCTKKGDLFKITETAKKELEGGKDEALLFLKKEREMLEKKAFFYRYSLEDEEKYLVEQTAELNEVKAKLNNDNSSRKGIKDKEKKLNDEFNHATEKMRQIDEKINTLKKAHKMIEKSKVTMNEQIKHMENKKKKATKALEKSNNTTRQAENSVTRLEDNLADYTKQVTELDQQLEVEKAALEEIKLELSDKTKEISGQIEELQQQLQPWKVKLDQKDGEITLKESEMSMLQSKLNELQEQTSHAKKRLQEIGELVKTKDEHKEYLERERNHVREQIAAGDDEVAEARGKLREMESELHAIRQRAEEAKANVSNATSRNRVLQALMHLKDSGRLNGFHGRLGDLGVIDDQYDVAVSTGGGSLDDYVVDTVECAQQCIQYMRNNNLGFGKFIVLQKLRKFKLNRIDTPVPRLFDLITPSDPRYAPAFYSSICHFGW
ncbi:unnamed protein product [Ambrosiozyma monospora]|uniref:Unnamed protein product n=1 Tax=Ambrosiozyma monospora TaxID=43982 RepID=A0ACB5TMY8_AMBMO|nr:unnamed protein product [Ambrosiozyma monospora]